MNLLGGVTLAAATLLTIPMIVREPGDANFGVLTLVTAVMGYFAALEVNVTAGSEKYVAEYDVELRHRMKSCWLAKVFPARPQRNTKPSPA